MNNPAAPHRSLRRPFVRPAVRLALPIALSLSGLATAWFGAGPARAANPAGPVLASIEGIHQEGLSRAVFALSGSTPLSVRAEGVGDSKGATFIAQGWILDLNSRQPVWTMEGAGGARDSKTDNWISQGEVTLPAGIYAAYFEAYGGPLPLDQLVRFFGFSLGRIEGNWGPTVKWNDRGKPARWGIRVQAVDAGYVSAPAPSEIPVPYPDAEVRLLGLPSSTVKRVRLDLARPVSFDVHFEGEYSGQAKAFSDFAWITDLASWETAWAPDQETARPAGGDHKNRMFSGTISLEKGSYLLTAATDPSHAPGDWNSPPPWDPDAWGIALKVSRGEDRAAVRITPDAALPAPVLAIERVGNNQFFRKPFTVTRACRVLVRAYGEAANGGGLVDYGWIERLRNMEQVWSMQDTTAGYGGGARKNRLVEVVLHLPPGGYNLCYGTDDSHAYGSWNQEAPWEPQSWGITLAELPDAGPPGLSPTSSGRGAITPGAPAGAPTILTLAPARDSEDRSKSFEIVEPVKVLLIAEGEGRAGEMMDYGWLTNDDTGRKVWEMTFDQTEPAGGALKNRIARERLDLGRGNYTLHFVTDDSHAFGDWNEAPPDQPQLWGITLVEEE